MGKRKVPRFCAACPLKLDKDNRVSASATHTRCKYCYLPDHPRHVRPADYPLPYAQAAALLADGEDLAGGADAEMADVADAPAGDASPPSASLLAHASPPVLAVAAVPSSLPALAHAPIAPAPPAPAATGPLPLALESAPLVELESDPDRCFAHYRYCILRGLGVEVARALQHLRRWTPAPGAPRALESDVLKVSETISGNVAQFNLSELKAFNTSVCKVLLRSLIDSVAARLGVPFAHVVAPKLLVAAQGEGLQAVHFDNQEVYDVAAAEKFTFIVYCPEGDGAHSTAMPRYPFDTLAPMRLTNNLADPTFQDGKRACAQYLDREWFHSVPVQSGDAMLFSQRVPHFGTANPVAAPRMALFSMLSSTEGHDQDAYQIFRWTYMLEAYNMESREHAQSLVDDAPIRPLDFYKGQYRQRAIASLNAHSLMDAYNAASAKPPRSSSNVRRRG